MNLHALIADPARHLARIQLRHRRFARHLHPRILHLRRAHRQQPRRVQLCRHRRQLELDRLKLTDRLAELPPFGRILHRRIQRPTRNPQAQRRNRDPSAIQHPHRILEALTLHPHQVLRRNQAVLKDQLRRIARPQPQLVFLLAALESRRPPLDHKPRDPPTRALLAIRHRQHQRAIRIAAVGNKDLPTVQHPALTPPHRRRPHPGRVRPRPRLGQPPRPQPLPARQLRHILLPLRIVARQHKVVRTQRVVRSHNNPHAPIHARQLLDRRHILHIPHPRPAQRLRKDHAHQPHLAHLLHDRMRKRPMLVPLRNMRRNLRPCKLPHRHPQRFLLFVQPKPHSATPITKINTPITITNTNKNMQVPHPRPFTAQQGCPMIN